MDRKIRQNDIIVYGNGRFVASGSPYSRIAYQQMVRHGITDLTEKALLSLLYRAVATISKVLLMGKAGL